jgi:hypothetical protein
MGTDVYDQQAMARDRVDRHDSDDQRYLPDRPWSAASAARLRGVPARSHVLVLLGLERLALLGQLQICELLFTTRVPPSVSRPVALAAATYRTVFMQSVSSRCWSCLGVAQ